MIRNVFYGVMLDILILGENIQKELQKLIEKLIVVLIMLKDFEKIEIQNNICINVFFCENEMVFSIYVSNQKFENSMELLLLVNDNKSHYVYIKGFNTFMFHKTKNKNKK